MRASLQSFCPGDASSSPPSAPVPSAEWLSPLRRRFPSPLSMALLRDRLPAAPDRRGLAEALFLLPAAKKKCKSEECSVQALLYPGIVLVVSEAACYSCCSLSPSAAQNPSTPPCQRPGLHKSHSLPYTEMSFRKLHPHSFINDRQTQILACILDFSKSGLF